MDGYIFLEWVVVPYVVIFGISVLLVRYFFIAYSNVYLFPFVMLVLTGVAGLLLEMNPEWVGLADDGKKEARNLLFNMIWNVFMPVWGAMFGASVMWFGKRGKTLPVLEHGHHALEDCLYTQRVSRQEVLGFFLTLAPRFRLSISGCAAFAMRRIKYSIAHFDSRVDAVFVVATLILVFLYEFYRLKDDYRFWLLLLFIHVLVFFRLIILQRPGVNKLSSGGKDAGCRLEIERYCFPRDSLSQVLKVLKTSGDKYLLSALAQRAVRFHRAHDFLAALFLVAPFWILLLPLQGGMSLADISVDRHLFLGLAYLATLLSVMYLSNLCSAFYYFYFLLKDGRASEAHDSAPHVL